MNTEYGRINELTRLQPSEIDSRHAALRKKLAQAKASTFQSYSPSIFLEDTQTTPTSHSFEAETPTRDFTRATSGRVSVTELSETSSTRAATPPPPVNSINVSLNREICSQSTSCAQLINLAVSKGHIFNAVNWATCLHRFAKLFPTEAKNHRSTVARFLSQAHEVLLSASEGAKFQPQHLATLLWAMAKLSIIDPGFVEDLIQRSIDVCDSLKAQDMANIAWSLAKMGIVHQRMFGIICARISDRKGIINQFKPMEIASTTWAFGTVGAKGMGVDNISVVIESLVSECLSRELRDFSPQALANVMWALAKLQYPHERLFASFGDHVVDSHRLREFKPQEIANVVWSMQSNGLVHPRLSSEIVHGKAINWTVFDPHALATVCGAMMELVDLNFALVIASRVMGSKMTKSGFSVSHAGILLCELSAHLTNPSVAAAASILTEKLLSDISVGSSVDIHTIRGLVATLAESPKLIDQLSRCCLVESEYAVNCQQTNIEFVLLRLAAASSGSAASQDLSRKIIILAKAVGLGATADEKCSSLSWLATVTAAAFKYAMIDSDWIGICELVLSRCDLMNARPDHIVPLLSVLSEVVNLYPSSQSLARLLAASCLDKVHKMNPPQLVGELVMSVNRLDFAVSGPSPDAVCEAAVTAAVTDCVSARPLDFSVEALSKVLYGASEFAARRGRVDPSGALTKLCEMAASLPTTSFSLSALARLIASAFTLELTSVSQKIVSASIVNQTLLAQCVQSGPGGLRLLRENLDSFSLYCKVVAAHLASGVVPGVWVNASDPLTRAETDNVFSLEGALCLSVSLGNVGAVEAQRDVISNWVLPLMGSSAASLLGGSSGTCEIENSKTEERLRSYSDLLSMCMPHSGFDLSEV